MRKKLLYFLLASLWSAVSLHAQIEYKRDSIVSLDALGNKTVKTVYAYDVRGNQILRTRYQWNNDSREWIGDFKEEYTHNVKGKVILVVSYLWNSSLNNWVGANKIETAYDVNGNLILYASYAWDGSLSDWVGYNIKFESVFDAAGNQTLDIWYNWNDNLSDWGAFYKIENAYDSKNNQILKTDYDWDSEHNNWKMAYKSEFFYDSDNKILFKKSSDGYVYVYDRNGGRTDRWFHHDAPPSSDYVFNYVLDADGTLTLTETFKQTITYKEEYVYDAYRNRISNGEYHYIQYEGMEGYWWRLYLDAYNYTYETQDGITTVTKRIATEMSIISMDTHTMLMGGQLWIFPILGMKS